MNAFNRVVVILLILLAAFLAVVLIVVPGLVLSTLVTVFQWANLVVTNYATGPDWPLFAAGRVVVGAVVIVIALVLLWLELRRPRKKIIRAAKTAGGESNISVDSIAQRVAWHIDQLPDVVRVLPRISSRASGVDVDLLLETSPEIDVPMKTEEVMQVTKEVIEERMGLKLSKVTINIKHAPYPES